MTLPDGMTVDAEGFLWIAIAGSGEVRRYSPHGAVETVVHAPIACRRVSRSVDRTSTIFTSPR